ncbi:PDDEXK family nuclease [Taibaiella soli]|uniref:DUF91 domain-containing protein n=1 Tax=Taibaiella soli TaxID=1649169 RepID=A0A2W2A854_9BACT|nr:hypothetical protein [Taibaiella soli]PZF71441.1 hypothetical protein DN068_19325 [Taibaiella soli]
MVTKGNRSNGQPIHVENGTATNLVRLPLDGKDFNEEWIQKLVHNNPAILPTNEIEPSFSPLIAIGREIATAAGYLDNLFVSPDGYLTIVETKLWRNPEARREVVGQIIDYAKELHKWNFTDLNNAIVAYNRLHNSNSDGLWATVQKQSNLNESDEQFFVDNISKNLKRGRFLLLIVGDGIRESVEDMVDYLSQSPQLHFTLALIELQVFKLSADNNSLIVIPQIVTRTKEITRAIVRIEGSNADDLKINIETDLGNEATDKKTATARLSITAEDYLARLELKTTGQIADFAKQIIKDAQDAGYYIEWNSGSFGVKLPDPQGSDVKIALFTVDKTGMVYLGFSQGQLIKLGLPLELSYDLAKDTAAILPGIQQNLVTKNSWNKYSNLSDLKPVYAQFMDRMKSYVDEITLTGQKNGS